MKFINFILRGNQFIILDMYYVYVLENQNDGSWYIGYTTDIKRRLFEH